MNRRIPVPVFAAALLAPALLPPLTRAAVWPDSAQRAALQSRIGHLGRVQILGSRGTTLLLKPVVHDDGLRMREAYHVPRQALIEIGDVPQPPRPVEFVPWSAIDSVQARRGMQPASMARGLFIGALAGALASLPYLQGLTEQIGSPTLAVALFAVPGAAIGLAFGAGAQHWHTVYPAPPSRR